jgi:hypothetical protein
MSGVAEGWWAKEEIDLTYRLGLPCSLRWFSSRKSEEKA